MASNVNYEPTIHLAYSGKLQSDGSYTKRDSETGCLHFAINKLKEVEATEKSQGDGLPEFRVQATIMKGRKSCKLVHAFPQETRWRLEEITETAEKTDAFLEQCSWTAQCRKNSQ